MKKIHKSLCIMLAFFMLMLVTLSASASEQFTEVHVGADGTVTEVNAGTFEYTVNEYEAYTSMIECSDEELLASGMDQSEIDEVRNFSFESALLERAQLPEDSLAAMGYTEEQIVLLKEYDGTPLVAGSSVLRATADCTGNIGSTSTHSTTAIGFWYDWSWSNVPIFQRTDMVAINWLGVSTTGEFINVNATSKSGKAHYESVQTGAFYGSDTLSFKAPTGFNGCTAEFPITKVVPQMTDGTISVYAREGYVTGTLTKTGTLPLDLIKVYGAYGHTTGMVKIGISFSTSMAVGFSFTPTTGTSSEAEALVQINLKGSVTDLS